MRKKGFIKEICLFIICSFLVGCTQNSTLSPTAANTSPSNNGQGAPTAVPVEMSADKGAVKVTFISTFTNKPLVNTLIRCASLIPMQGISEGVSIPALDFQNSPWGNTDENGTVVFSKVEPGKYAFAYISPIGMAEIIKVEGTTDTFTFEVTANKLTDLGTLRIHIDPQQIN